MRTAKSKTKFKLPEHLFVSDSDGGLYDTRRPDWSKGPPIREKYCWHHRNIQTTHQLKACLRAGPAAWPGGYEILYIASDGALLCTKCVLGNLRSCLWSIKNECSDGWRITAVCTEATSAEMVREHNEEYARKRAQEASEALENASLDERAATYNEVMATFRENPPIEINNCAHCNAEFGELT